MWKKGDRIVVSYGADENYLGTVSMIRQGNVCVRFDGGKKDSFVPDSEQIRGRGTGETRESVIADAALSDFLSDGDEKPARAKKRKPGAKPAKKANNNTRKEIGSYAHSDRERLNNPDIGLVSADTDRDDSKKTYRFDYHLDPELCWNGKPDQFAEERLSRAVAANRSQSETLDALLKEIRDGGITDVAEAQAALEKAAQLAGETGRAVSEMEKHQAPHLNWSGKAERTSFEVPTVSLHVHERVDPVSIIEAVKQEEDLTAPGQLSLFDMPPRPRRQAIEFYKHQDEWSNRLVAGDSLLVMNSLLEKEGMGGKVQMIYFDPPYGIRYQSNFQPFVNKRDVKDRKDEDLTAEPEMLKAFRDTWELGIHSYLSYLKDRLWLAKALLHESGSVFVQISDENVHRVRMIMDEVFGSKNFLNQITFQKTGGIDSGFLGTTVDYLIWYAKDKNKLKYQQLYNFREAGSKSLDRYDLLCKEDGTSRRLSKEEIKSGEIKESGERYQLAPLYSDGASSGPQEFIFQGNKYLPRKDTHWKTTLAGLEELAKNNRIEKMGKIIRYKRFASDFPVIPITDRWESMQLGIRRSYVVQTSNSVIQRCILMTTDPGDIVFDPTCGSGTTAYVAEQWGRRWITCDTSRVALTLAKQRLMTALFDYYELAHPDEGVGSGLIYKTVPHITLKSIANNEPPAEETLYDQPVIDRKKARVTGPFTVEAVPAPMAKSLEEIEQELNPPAGFGNSASRSGETLRQTEWRDELLKTGVRARGGERIGFARMEPLSGTRFLQAEAETTDDPPKRAVIAFGPEFAPLEQRQVEMIMDEAERIHPGPDMLLFAAFQFDEGAAQEIDEAIWKDVTLLKVQMNADLFTDDLKKKRSSDDSFWLIGQPDVSVTTCEEKDGAGRPMYQTEVIGFDYYDPKTGTVRSGGKQNIAMWMLDTDYNGRSVIPRQVFFPMAGDRDGWGKLSKSLKAEIDPEKIEAFRGTKSLPFKKADRIAVKIIDDRGIESLKVIHL
ncbi:site-specific DNA-methyltransferase [Desulfonema ishimotonii]|nr:DNA methyltransferase [Desulfonema ishimotonii]